MPKINLGGPLGGFLGGLGRSWGGLGGILAPRWLQEPQEPRKVISGAPSWGPFWGPKSIKIAPKSDPKSDHFFDRFEDRFLDRFGSNLVPFGPLKVLKSKGWGVPRGLLGGSWGLLAWSWGPLNPKMAPRAKKTPKNQSFDPLLGAILGPKIDQNRSQERPEMLSFLLSI